MGQLEKSPSKDKDVLLITGELLTGSISHLLHDLHERYPEIKVEIVTKDKPLDSFPEETLNATKYILGFANFPRPEQVPNLKYVQIFSAGSNHLHGDPLWKHEDDVTWCSASGVHGPIIAEYCVMAILALCHRYFSSVHYFQGTGCWPPNWPKPVPPQRELYGQTIGIVGYGAIGRNTAKLLTGFNVDIITLNSTKKSTPEERRQKEEYTVPGTGDIPGDIPVRWYASTDPEEKKKFFEESDVVIVTAPYTPATKHLVDATALSRMKETSLIVNIARGELIDQDALIQVLQEKKIAGAALDVVTPEPYPSDGDLLKKFGGTDDRERLIMTPHVSGHTPDYNLRVVDILEQNLARMKKGEALLNVINRKKGF
jgi:phosphoglycerate dehydrogenase-like enzyme